MIASSRERDFVALRFTVIRGEAVNDDGARREVNVGIAKIVNRSDFSSRSRETWRIPGAQLLHLRHAVYSIHRAFAIPTFRSPRTILLTIYLFF